MKVKGNRLGKIIGNKWASPKLQFQLLPDKVQVLAKESLSVVGFSHFGCFGMAEACMKTIDYFSHTADLRMKLAADSLPELFEAALSGMNEILRPGGCAGDSRQTIEKKIQLKSRDITTLLVEFMNEVLALSYTCNALFCTLQITLLTNRELVCVVTGREVPGFDDDIKAVTYHEADVRTNAEGKLETIIVFDI